MRSTGVIGALFLAIGSAACDPCAGMLGCRVAARVAVVGRVLDDSTGRPAVGVPVDFIRTGGAALEVDSVRATTGDNGTFSVSIQSEGSDTVVADIVISPPGAPAYRLRGLSIAPSTVRGEAVILPTWSTRLSLPDLAIVYRRDGAREQFAHTGIFFRQTGGAAVTGLDEGTFYAVTDASGYARLFGNLVRPLEDGEVIGDLELVLPGALNTLHKNIRIPVRPEFHAPAQVRFFGAGPSVNYHFAFASRGNGIPSAGTRVDFRQDSGTAITPSTWSRTTDGSGRVAVPSRIESYGTVYGVITITPPSPWKSYERSVVLPAFDADDAELYGVYGIGPGTPYYVIITKNGVRTKDIPVEFQRTGGVAISPSAFATVTNDSGAAFMSLAPSGEGEIVGDITVRPPAPFATFVVRNVKLQAIDGDLPARIVIGTWDVASPPVSALRIP
jgi:hypothetical protein